jgi:hypothetical protein
MCLTTLYQIGSQRASPLLVKLEQCDKASRCEKCCSLNLDFIQDLQYSLQWNSEEDLRTLDHHFFPLFLYYYLLQIYIYDHIACNDREPKRWFVSVLYVFLFIYFSVFILPFNWIITLHYTNMSYNNNNTPIVEHIITTYKLICVVWFQFIFSRFIISLYESTTFRTRRPVRRILRGRRAR